MLIDWIQNHLNISFKKAQIYNIIKDLGFTYQKSKGFYPETDPEKQEEFKVELKKLLEYPINTVLLFEDEFSLSNTATISYQWSVQPKVKSKQRRRQRKTAMGSFNYRTDQITVSFHDIGNYQSFKKNLKKYSTRIVSKVKS